MRFALHRGDCRRVFEDFASDGFDSVVTDPPYHLTTGMKGGNGILSMSTKTPYNRARITGFMGKAWDGGDVAFQSKTWFHILRLVKPGGYLVAFGGTRTFHRLMCAIEDAGWEIRDTLMWVYGSGFPKSHNGEWGGTALKPGWEPIVLARKPLIGAVAANFAEHGTGGLNIDRCRVGTDHTRGKASKTAFGLINDDAWKPREVIAGSACGRWPANLVHDGSDEVIAAFPNAPGQQGDLRQQDHAVPAGNAFGQYGPKLAHAKRADSGSAARFFYCAKASKSDRGEGNDHPTVKPTALMRWLCGLVTPTGGHVLDPFMGSGSTGKAALLEGFDFTGCDLDAHHMQIARRRLGCLGEDLVPADRLERLYAAMYQNKQARGG